MFSYYCANDGYPMRQTRNTDIQSSKDEETGDITNTMSLGTWRCPKCGGKKVKREKK